MSRLRALLPWYLWVLFLIVNYLTFTIGYYRLDMPDESLSFVVTASHQRHFVTYLVIPFISLALVRLQLRTRRYLVTLRNSPTRLRILTINDGILTILIILAAEYLSQLLAYGANRLLHLSLTDNALSSQTSFLLLLTQIIFFCLWGTGYLGWLRYVSAPIAYLSILLWPIFLIILMVSESMGWLTAPLLFFEATSISWHFLAPLGFAVLWAFSADLARWFHRLSFKGFSSNFFILAIPIVGGGAAIIYQFFGTAQTTDSLTWTLSGFYQSSDFLMALFYTLLLLGFQVLFTNLLSRRTGLAFSLVALRGGLTGKNLGKLMFLVWVALLITTILFLAVFCLTPWIFNPHILTTPFLRQLTLFACGFSLTGLLPMLAELIAQATAARRFVGMWCILVGYFGLGLTPLSNWLPWICISPLAGTRTQLFSILVLASSVLICALIFAQRNSKKGIQWAH